jgi:magnesium-transporting ATPase (P-type)
MEVKPARVDWHSISEKKLFEVLGTSPKGLSQKEVEERLKEYGYNELAGKKGKTALQIFLSQLKIFSYFY